MFKLECTAKCGNYDQYNGFEDTEKGFICKKCGQLACPMENNESEKTQSVSRPKLKPKPKFGMTLKTKFGFGTYLCNHLSRYYVLINQSIIRGSNNPYFNKIINVGIVEAYKPNCWKCGKKLNSWDNSTCHSCHYLICDACGSCSKEHVNYSVPNLKLGCQTNLKYMDERFYLSADYDSYRRNSLGPFPLAFVTVDGMKIWPPFVFNPNFISAVEILLDNGIRFGLSQAPSSYIEWEIYPYWETCDLGSRDKTYDLLRSKGIIKDYVGPF